MQKKRSFWIVLLTAAVALGLSVFVGLTIRSVNRRITQACFDELAATSRLLAEELAKTSEMDRAILAATAARIADAQGRGDGVQSDILADYDCPASYMSSLELLRPDGTLLLADGLVLDAAGVLDFDAEAQRGEYISGLAQSAAEPGAPVVRHGVPVVQNGRTVAMLYGIVRLSGLAESYRTDLYGGNAYVYLEDGDSGDFLLDTWHGSLGNIQDFGSRRTMEGDDFHVVVSDLENGRSGDISFLSETTGGVLFMHYEPVDINNWNVIVTVEKEYALRGNGSIRSSLYHMAALVGAVGFTYMAAMLLLLFRAYRRARKLGMQDQTTGLQNRNAFEKYAAERQKRIFASIACIYVDANGLHEINNRYGHTVGDQMLRIVAESLVSRFEHSSVYRVGGDEFIVFCEEGDEADCAERMREVTQRIEAHSYSISFGIACYQNEMGVERVTREADERMLEKKREYYACNDRRRD